MMGWSTAAVDDTSLWQFQHAAAGFRRFHGADTPKPGSSAPTAEQFHAAMAAAREQGWGELSSQVH